MSTQSTWKVWQWPARVLLALILWCAVGPVQAQTREGESDGMYSFVFSGIPVSDALGTLIDKTTINLIFESEIVRGKTTFCRANRLHLEATLKCVLEGTELDFIRLSSGTYIIVPSSRSEALLGSVSGSIRDAETGDPIEGANVILLTGDVGMASNRAGRFAFRDVVSGPHVLAVSHVSYEVRLDTLQVRPSENSDIVFTLNRRTIRSEPLVVTSSSFDSEFQRRGTDRIGEVDLLDLNPLATVNVMQVVDGIDGVGLGGSLSTVHLQGGSSGEHVYRLDGVRVFVPIRLGGLIGPFSPFAIGEINVRKAGFGAQEGSQLSGIIDIDHRISPDTPRRVEFQIDPISINARIGGRTDSQSDLRMSWMVAARRDVQFSPYFARLDHIMDAWSEPDFFLIDALRENNGLDPLDTEIKSEIRSRRYNYNVAFTDIHAAVRAELGTFHSLQSSFYHNRNLFSESVDYLERAGIDLNSEDRYRWENTTGMLRYEGILSGRVFADAGVRISSYRLLDTFGGNPIGNLDASACSTDCEAADVGDDFNEVTEFGIDAGIQVALSRRHSLTTKMQASLTESDFALTLQPASPPIQAEILRDPVRWLIVSVLEDHWSISRSMQIRAGSRLTYVQGQEAVYVEPRISFEGDLTSGRMGILSLQAAVGLYRQFTHQVDVSTYNVSALFPSIRYWIPLDRSEKPPEAVHFTARLSWAPSRNWLFSVDGYIKRLPHVYVLNYGAYQHVGADEEGAIPPLLTKASGRASGVGTTARYEGGRVRIELRYEHGLSSLRVSNRFNGRSVETPWQIPHRLMANFEFRPVTAVVLSLRWELIRGRSWAFRRAYYDYIEPSSFGDESGFVLARPEGDRLPAYSQVDAGATYSTEIGAVKLQARLHVLNLFDRTNVRDWSIGEPSDGSGGSRQARSGIPLLPMFSLRIGV